MHCRLLILFFLVFSTFTMTSCVSAKHQTKVSLSQGIVGQVFEQKGNKMPQVGKVLTKGDPFPTIVYVFEPTFVNQGEQIEGHLFKTMSTKLVGSYPTDHFGKFNINLTPGIYTVVVGYEGAYFTPYFSAQNELSLVHVANNVFTNLDVIINVKASY